MPDRSVILSVRLKKASRPVCGFERVDNQEDYKSGTCHLQWRILEPGDGAVLQIIYAGSARRDPKLEGVVEGQPDGIVVQEFSVARDSTNISVDTPVSRVVPMIILFLGGALLVTMAHGSYDKTEAGKQLAQEKAASEKHLAELMKRRVPVPPGFWFLLGAGFVCFFGGFALLYLLCSRSGPPFGW
jgi:hypothetical protein